VLFACVAVFATGWADDRQDSPDLQNGFVTGQVDLAGLYVFRSPTNLNNTVFILLAGPHAQVITRPYFDPKARYEIKIDNSHDFKPDLTFRVRFGPPDANGTQTFKLQRMIGRKPFQTIAEGTSGLNTLFDGGFVRAGLFDDPFFFDAFAFNDLFADGVGNFPRAPANAKNFYGPNANILGIVIEVPSSTLIKEGQPASTVIGVWGRVTKNGVQIDRVGRPMTNVELIPPVPRNAATKDLRKLFNRGQPQNDLRVFGSRTIEILQNFFGRSESDANALANLFLPDVQFFQLGNPNGFGTFLSDPDLGNVLGNGRRLRDDTIDFLLTVLTNGAITSDNVPDDNGARITDGDFGTTAAFPYIGPPNSFVSGPNP